MKWFENNHQKDSNCLNGFKTRWFECIKKDDVNNTYLPATKHKH